jgi:hypothetical protein
LFPAAALPSGGAARPPLRIVLFDYCLELHLRITSSDRLRGDLADEKAVATDVHVHGDAQGANAIAKAPIAGGAMKIHRTR